MDDGLLCLKWNNHKKDITKSINLYRNQALYSDVTLACSGQCFKVHKIILSSCSEYFQDIFSMTQCKQPVVILKDVRPKDVEHLLQYIYMGEVEVKQSELAELIKAAECLKIKNLANLNDNMMDEISKKKKRKRHSSYRPKSPKNKNKFIPSNIHSDASLNLQTSENTQHLNEPIELFKTESAELIKASKSLKIKGLATSYNDSEDELPPNIEDKVHPKKRKIPFSVDRPESPKKQPKTSSSNIHSDASLNLQTSQNTLHLNEPIKLIKTEPDDVDIIEEIRTKSEFDNLKENAVIFDDNCSIPKYSKYMKKCNYIKKMHYAKNDASLNLQNSQNPQHLNEPLKLINIEPDEVDIIEEIGTNSSIPKYNYIKKEMLNAENEPQKENFDIDNSGTPEYDSEADSSGCNEDPTFDNSSYVDASYAHQEYSPTYIEITTGLLNQNTEHLKRKYSCRICKFQTTHIKLFKDHVRLHREKPFECKFCVYRSAQELDVKKHERFHTDDLYYACIQCPFTTAMKLSLHYHYLSKHKFDMFQFLA